jgi:hypothetical protein
MSTALARRLNRLEEVAREAQLRRLRDAVREMAPSLAPEHCRALGHELRALVDSPTSRTMHASYGRNHICPSCIDRHRPSSLARAGWVLLVDRSFGGGPALLPPPIAAVYEQYPDARPASRCINCGYLRPARRGVLVPGVSCPGCAARPSPER